ncbi:HD domain-containing protein [Streptomyces sp. NPDC054904]|uniref:HD domain-containing protein n=1 Tax=unclassified Streptomyces TaxID=2593676 RepID=UPI0037955EF6
MLKTCTELGLTAEEMDRLGVVWGKSAALGGGTMNLLISHMLDTAAVAERVWDTSLAASLKQALDEVAGGRGRGRRLFAWLCGIHDCGKATPAWGRRRGRGGLTVMGTAGELVPSPSALVERGVMERGTGPRVYGWEPGEPGEPAGRTVGHEYSNWWAARWMVSCST